MRKRKPRISILSPDFHYTSAVKTDLAATFAAARARLAEAQVAGKVVPIKKDVSK